MKSVIFLGTNRCGEWIYEWLNNREDINVLALLTEKDQFEVIEKLKPDYLVSSGFSHIVPEEILEIPQAAINCHLSYLPHNRGMNPNVWTIINNTPAGVSLHYMTPELDEGPLIARKMIEKNLDDNGKDLYERQEQAMFDLFKKKWGEILDGKVDAQLQNSHDGSHHYLQEFLDLREIDPDEEVRVGDFIDRLRAMTFPPYNNSYIEKGGEKYYIDISITHENEVHDESFHWNTSDEYEE